MGVAGKTCGLQLQSTWLCTCRKDQLLAGAKTRRLHGSQRPKGGSLASYWHAPLTYLPASPSLPHPLLPLSNLPPPPASCHQSIHPLRSMLAPYSPALLDRVVAVSLAAVTALFAVVTLAAYVAFGPDVR